MMITALSINVTDKQLKKYIYISTCTGTCAIVVNHCGRFPFKELH